MEDRQASELIKHPERIPLEGAARMQVEITEAAAEHVVAWDTDQRVKAVHEAGHAVAARLLGMPVTGVDITGRFGGHTELGIGSDALPDTVTDSMLLDRIVVRLAAGAAERSILGQGTLGSAEDLTQATGLAYERFDAGLDPEAPFISLRRIPARTASEALFDAFAQRAMATLRTCRERADALVSEHRELILAFAARLYAARRLTDADLEEAFVAVGLATGTDD